MVRAGFTLTRSRIIALVVGLYILLVVAASLYFRVSLSPDRFVLLLVIAGLATGRVRQFLKDWSIFLIVLVAWQVLTGYSRDFGHLRPHITEMIVFDRWLFHGHLPTIWLQSHFYHPGHLAWYDVASAVLYLLHFVFPIAVAFVLWVWRRTIFVEFMMSFLVLALAGFATFILFPAAPPWLAAEWHYLPPVHRVLYKGIMWFGGQQSYSVLYNWMYQQHAWDVVGAVPSEHAGFPFLCFLYARQAWPARGWFVLPYCLAICVAVVYMGEHYIMDVVVGILYATLAYGAIQVALRRFAGRPLEEAPATKKPAVSDSALA
ncbi:MAG: phosphatase PAP2 family protein [Chloroflexota bacterium]|nr:phosphatase PAP2 family protein [Chloroflexota bacterium]